MILISSVKLEHKISENELTSWEKTKYLIFMVVVSSMSGPIYVFTPSFGPKPPPLNMAISFFSSIAFILISYFGLKKCYKTNKSIDDAYFIERFAILNVPMTIKFSLFFLSVGIAFALLSAYVIERKELFPDSMFYLFNVGGIIVSIVYYIFLNRSFHRLAFLMRKNNEP
jgi:hypothetical protein